jgi:hypothetical protein
MHEENMHTVSATILLIGEQLFQAGRMMKLHSQYTIYDTHLTCVRAHTHTHTHTHNVPCGAQASF